MHYVSSILFFIVLIKVQVLKIEYLIKKKRKEKEK